MILIILAISSRGYSMISEAELQGQSSGFMSKITSDNPDFKQKITEYLNGVIKSNNSAIKLIDKFGLFIFDCKKNGVVIHKTRFYHYKDTFFIFILFRDRQEGEYTLFLEYEFSRSANTCTLMNIYFSLVFHEKKEEIENFFRYR